MFVLAFDNANNGDKKVERNTDTKYFLPKVNITNYFYDQPNQIKKYDEIWKTVIGQGDDYATGCLLDYQYFKDH